MRNENGIHSVRSIVSQCRKWIRDAWYRHKYPYRPEHEPPRTSQQLRELRITVRRLHDEWRTAGSHGEQITPGYKAGLLAFGHMRYLIDELEQARQRDAANRF